MCGITGANFAAESAIARANHACRHRGPDATGIFCDGHVTLGHQRLSIIDLSTAADQPMSYTHAGRTVHIVFNGEVYNFAEIRAELQQQGYRFSTHGDTEVILAAYLHYGEECFHRFEGMWALALYEAGSLLLSVDQFGKKPLYYHVDPEGRCRFASEIKSLLAAGVPAIPDMVSLSDYLYYDITDHTDRTFFLGIRRLSAGHLLRVPVFPPGTETTECHRSSESNLPAQPPQPRAYHRFWVRPPTVSNPDQAADEVDRLIRRSIGYRLVADVPISISLSGGVDSSTIAALIGTLGDTPMHAFTLVYRYPGAQDETENVRRLLERYPQFILEPVEILPEHLAEHAAAVIRHQEQPIEGHGAFVRYMIARAVHQKGFKVLLVGEGGDEVFSGYRSSHAAALAVLLRGGRLGEFVRILRKTRSRVHVLAHALGFAAPRWARRIMMGVVAARARTNLGLRLPHDSSRKIRLSTVRNVNDYPLRSLQHIILPRLLLYNDKMAMAHSVEGRSPLLTVDLAEYSFNLGPELKLRGGYAKYILRRVAERYVPREIAWDRRKLGFPAPVAQMLKSSAMQTLMKQLFTQPRSSAVLDPAQTRAAYHDYLRGGKTSAHTVLKALWTELWFREFFGEAGTANNTETDHEAAPEVSVFCTVKNGEAMLPYALESVVRQEGVSWELIVVDDGSTDGTAGIVHRFAQRFPADQVRLISSPGMGRGAALNAAWSACRAPLVANLDADDLFHPRKLALQRDAMLADQDIAVLATESCFIAGTEQPQWDPLSKPAAGASESPLPESPLPERQLLEITNLTPLLGRFNPVNHSSVMMRRAELQRFGGYDQTRVRQLDYELWIRFAAAGVSIHSLNLPLSAKRLHAGQSFEARISAAYIWSSFRLQLRAIRALRLSPLLYPLALVRVIYRFLPAAVRRPLASRKRAVLQTPRR